MQSVMPPVFRARASLIYLASNTLVGGLGPYAIGISLRSTGTTVGTSLLVVTVLGFSISGLLFVRLGVLLQRAAAARGKYAGVSHHTHVRVEASEDDGPEVDAHAE